MVAIETSIFLDHSLTNHFLDTNFKTMTFKIDIQSIFLSGMCCWNPHLKQKTKLHVLLEEWLTMIQQKFLNKIMCIVGKGYSNSPISKSNPLSHILTSTPPPHPSPLAPMSPIPNSIYITVSRGGLSFSLKLASAIFYQIFILSANESSSKTTENVFYFI